MRMTWALTAVVAMIKNVRLLSHQGIQGPASLPHRTTFRQECGCDVYSGTFQRIHMLLLPWRDARDETNAKRAGERL